MSAAMDNLLFKELVRATAHEITARMPDYFSQYEVAVPPLDALASAFRALPGCELLSMVELEDGMIKGLKVLEDVAGAALELDCEHTDVISTLLLHGIADACSAAYGVFPLQLPPDDSRACFEAVFSDRYGAEETHNGVRYACQKGAGRPLLIISATGMPLTMWSNVLGDAQIERRCLAVSSRGGPLMAGGTPHASTLLQDAADIQEVLVVQDLQQVDIVGWCNGARTAVELARNTPDRIASLTLAAPSFYGSVDAQEYPSPFEDSMRSAYRVLQQDCANADALLEYLVKMSRAGDGTEFLDAAQERAGEILRWPPRAWTSELLLPLSSVETFYNYVKRAFSDDAYDMRSAIADIRCPILLLTGTHDAAVNTRAARDILEKHGHDVLHVTVEGAGHHIHLLQYGYFKYVLNRFLAGGIPVKTARLDVQRLAHS